MPQLTDHPDLAQLRRQARELLRAAAGGDADAIRRVRQVSEKTTLSTAQLALAREYGFPSWPRLKDEAERRRASAGEAAQQRFGYPDYLTAEAGELIEGQYADRPQLRPILDAVLALLPALGPATVQARRTIVSLVCPRRTFAVVRATTKDRVDLGLRLDDAEPGGRLQSAKGIGGGGATVRIALRRPEDIDEEVRGLMRRAYEETRPRPRRGVRDDRHLGLIWGDLLADGTLKVFRGAKLRLVDVDPDLIEQALRPGHTLVARIRLTDARGNPICARVHPPYLTWSVATESVTAESVTAESAAAESVTAESAAAESAGKGGDG